MKGTAMVLAAALVCLSGTCRANGFDWPRWRGPDGNGVSKETDWDPNALAGGPKVLWTVDVGKGYSSVVIQGGRLYTAGTTEGEPTVSCLNESTGDTVWRRPYDDFYPPQSTPVIDGERVYALGGNGLLLCLRASDGTVLWQRSLAKDFEAPRPFYYYASSPVAEGGLVLVNVNSAALAFEESTGTLVWSVKDTVPVTSSGSYATPVVCDVDGRRTAVILGPGNLTAVDVATGTKLWSYSHGDEMHPVADPLISGGAVFFTVGNSCGLIPLDKGGPPVLWSSSEMTTWLPAPVLVDGYLYGTHFPPSYYAGGWIEVQAKPHAFRCVEWSTGKVVWENPMKYVSVTGAGSLLFLLELNGTLHIADASPAAYHERGSADVLKGVKRPRTFATPPVLCNGRIYCRNFAGDLVCIDGGRQK